MGDWLFDNVVTRLAKAVLTTLTGLWELLAQTAFTTPDVTKLPQVTAITGRSLAVVNTCFVLAIITGGIIVMTHETVQIRYGVGDVVPRLVVGFLAANFSTPLCSHLIELANALTQALTGEGIAAKDSFEHLLRVVTAAMNNPGNAFLLVIMGLIIATLTGMLLAAWMVRLAVLIVLVGVAPLALACHALPYTDAAARLWWRALLGCLAVVVLQALALHTTLSIFLNPKANVPSLGLPKDPTGTFNLFVVVCLLWVTVRIPGLVRRYVTRDGGQRTVAAVFVRMVLLNHLSRLLRAPLRSRRAATSRSAAGGGSSVAEKVIPYWRPRMPRPIPGARRVATPEVLAPATGAARPADEPSVPGTVPRVPTWVSPATTMPPRRPRWQVRTQPSATGWPDPPAARTAPVAGARPTGTGWAGRPIGAAGAARYRRTGVPGGR
jgi:hypothetical protein